MADALDRRVLDELRASVGGDQEFFAELVDELLADAPRQLDALRAALAAGDAESARRAAHTLKGNGRTFGATEFAAACLEAETAAANGDLGPLPPLVDEMAALWEQVSGELLAARDAPA